ncbi:MAG: CPBP family intramembrane metalloprotease [Rhodospirillales bacterium]|nr:CPBP family intramembrane metalloprotease [Rhodospirillales bacterium]
MDRLLALRAVSALPRMVSATLHPQHGAGDLRSHRRHPPGRGQRGTRLPPAALRAAAASGAWRACSCADQRGAFGLTHLTSGLADTLNAFLAGILLGYLYYATGRLGLCITVHYVDNLTVYWWRATVSGAL